MTDNAYRNENRRFLRALMSAQPVSGSQYSLLPRSPGIYYIGNGTTHLYVGTATDLRRRYYNHSGRASTPATSSLIRNIIASLDARIGDEERLNRAREIIQDAECRFVTVDDPATIKHLEKFVISELRPKYNR